MKKNINLKPIDYKDVATLKTFLDSYGRIMRRRQSGISLKRQRAVARAVKRARFMGLIPHIAH